MAICDVCDNEMTTSRSCSASALHRDSVPSSTRPHRGRQRCGDCGVAPGGFHHLGCDMQRCPGCGGQLISCGCRFDELPQYDEDEDEDEDWTQEAQVARHPAAGRALRPPAGH